MYAALLQILLSLLAVLASPAGKICSAGAGYGDCEGPTAVAVLLVGSNAGSAGRGRAILEMGEGVLASGGCGGHWSAAALADGLLVPDGRADGSRSDVVVLCRPSGDLLFS